MYKSHQRAMQQTFTERRSMMGIRIETHLNAISCPQPVCVCWPPPLTQITSSFTSSVVHNRYPPRILIVLPRSRSLTPPCLRLSPSLSLSTHYNRKLYCAALSRRALNDKTNPRLIKFAHGRYWDVLACLLDLGATAASARGLDRRLLRLHAPLLLTNLQGGRGRRHCGRRVRHRGHYRCVLRTRQDK